METLKKSSIAIVGGGISGLTAGIYALDNGFDVAIYEKHSIPGGECTGWYRKGTYIEGCAHWIVGTNPKSDLFPLWKHVGAFDESSTIYETEYLTKFYLSNGELFTFYADLAKLKEEMLRHFPSDKRMINNFIRNVKFYQSVAIPTKKPMEYMNVIDLMVFGLRMLPMALPFAYYKHVSMKEYCSHFKNKELGDILLRFLPENYNVHSFFYISQAVSLEDAGMVEGGSLAMINRIKNTYLAKGGKLFLNKPVSKINVTNNIATGLTLEDGEIINSDYVISSCDAYHLLNNLLDGKYKDSFFESRFTNEIDNPLVSSVQISFRTKKDISSFPKMVDYLIDEIPFLASKLNHFCIRNFSFDRLLNKNGYTTFTILIPTNSKDYEYLKNLSKEDYIQKKEEIGAYFKKESAKAFSLNDEDIELLDVTTPLTYERYCNAYKGSYMSFLTTKNSKGLMRKGEFGIKNFALAGQWVMPPGGLPIALFSGKHAAIRICKMDKRKFKNLENSDIPSLKILKTTKI